MSDTSDNFKLNLDELDPRPEFQTQRDEIGRGTTGVVYRAKYKNQPVAVKRFYKEYGPDEWKMLRSLSHPNVVKLIAYDEKAVCMVMELVEGGSLSSLLQDRTKYPNLSWSLRLKIAIDIVEGLMHLHSQDPPIIHRDLKPSNILLRADWSCVIVEFGVAKEKAESTVGTNLADTIPYMAPEMLGDDGHHSHNHDPKDKPKLGVGLDIYSFGMILYELMTRQPPWEGTPIKQIFKVVPKGERPTMLPESECPSRKDSPLGYGELIRACWHQDPEKRPKLERIKKNLEFMSVRSHTQCSDHVVEVLENPLQDCILGSLHSDEKMVEDLSPIQALGAKIITIIVQYFHPLRLGYFPIHSKSVSPRWCWGLVSNGKQLFVGGNPVIDTYSLSCRLVNDSPLKNFFSSDVDSLTLDIFQNNFYLHSKKDNEIKALTILERKQVCSFTTRKQSRGNYCLGIRVEEERIFCTFYGTHRVFCYLQSNGESFGILIAAFGNDDPSSAKGKFNFPAGLELESTNIYVCDIENHRVQIFDKLKGTYINQWGTGEAGSEEGQFTCPRCIHHKDGLYYIGDDNSISVWNGRGVCLQRIGDKKQFTEVQGLWVVKNNLYVSESGTNNRIQVFSMTLDGSKEFLSLGSFSDGRSPTGSFASNLQGTPLRLSNGDKSNGYSNLNSPLSPLSPVNPLSPTSTPPTYKNGSTWSS